MAQPCLALPESAHPPQQTRPLANQKSNKTPSARFLLPGLRGRLQSGESKVHVRLCIRNEILPSEWNNGLSFLSPIVD